MGEFLGEFEQLILFAVLRLGDEAYGVSVREEIERRTGRPRALRGAPVVLEPGGPLDRRAVAATARRR